jgi:hypothetical protein
MAENEMSLAIETKVFFFFNFIYLFRLHCISSYGYMYFFSKGLHDT